MAERSTVKLISKDGQDTIVLPTTEPGEINRFRALGWTEASYDDSTVEELKAEIDRRNEGRPDDATVPKTGNKADLVAALQDDDQATA